MTEKKFWEKIRDSWPGHAVRTEASEGGVEPGFPDCILSTNCRGVYIELKVWPEPLRPLQLPWHLDALDRGAYAEVWAWLPNGGVWCGLAEGYQQLLDAYEMGDRRSPAGQTLDLCLKRLRKILLS
jgi:hypothetical protein